MSNFITNDQSKNLLKRLQQLIKQSEELKFLVGFFYFSGIKELYQSLLDNNDITLKILVGLNVDVVNYQLVECIDTNKNLSGDAITQRFFDSVKKSINTSEFDTEDFYHQIRFFIDLINKGNCIIRKTIKPNHAKLYIFKLKQEQVKRSLFITGSSNLTKAGLVDQSEFNVEIADYGIDEANKYFDEQWNIAVKITEDTQKKEKLIALLENETFIKLITPFEAYCLVLKTYLDTYEIASIGEYLCTLLRKNGYEPYKYQLDAVSQALSIIQKHNGVILADVVGLGKTIIACAIAKQLKKRGVVICPPGLVGDKNKNVGWSKYLEDFQLFDWEARSLGDLEDVLDFVNAHSDIEVIIIDEAHRFRNQDTRAYELLKNICRNKIVIALTATPFNNRPSDIFSIIKLFVTPRQSTITLDNNIEFLFSLYRSRFDKLSYIKRYYNSTDSKKRGRAKAYYNLLFDDKENIDLRKITQETHRLARQIRNVIEPITIRRNRIDLQKNPYYKDEVKQLSKVCDPIEWFYELSPEQLQFYDTVIMHYFGDTNNGGQFKGAIYKPFVYEEGELDVDADDITNENLMEKNREYIQQTNLFHFMRRLLVKRFESSFGAFRQSIENFKRIHQNVLAFITKTGNGDPLNGEFILDRALMEKIYDLDLDEIEPYLQQYEQQINAGVLPKKHKRYKIKDFKYKEEFIEDIKSDIQLFDTILKELEELDLTNNDPKLECLITHIQKEFSKQPARNEPKRKIVIFSEFKDTVEYVESKLNETFNRRVLVVAGDLPSSKIQSIYKNFDASYKNQDDEYDILLCTDKISEGFNLNRAGMIINYDIPWNPVRVIQRLGRINRISKKVFDELYIVNFFPTEKGAEIVKSREIAQNKMFMIHNTLGEDAKIFDVDEDPSPAELYNRLQQNPETLETESFYTKVLNIFSELQQKYPEVIKNIHTLPRRIKVSRKSNVDELLVFFKKNRLYVMQYDYATQQIQETTLEDVLERIQCSIEEQGLPVDERLWNAYEKIKSQKESRSLPASELSLYQRAKNKINFLIQDSSTEEIQPFKDFLMLLREDIIDYGTLPDYTLRRIVNLKTDFKNEEQKKELINEIASLHKELGDNYLEKEKHRSAALQKEIIIAIENKIIPEV